MSLLGGFSKGVIGLAQAGSKINNDVLKQEFGIVLQDRRASSTLEAFKDPVVAFEKYKDQREAVVEAAKDVYNKSLEAATKSGLPMENAVEYAKKRAVAYYQDEIELLNLSHPYAESAEGMIALATGARRRDLLEKYKNKPIVQQPPPDQKD